MAETSRIGTGLIKYVVTAVVVMNYGTVFSTINQGFVNAGNWVSNADVRGLGTSLIKYIATAVVVMNYGAVFTTINQSFVNAGNWVSNASGALNLLDNWKIDLQTQFNQAGSQKLWGLITADIPGLLMGS